MSDTVERVWGAYCAQCDWWMLQPNGELMYYPHPELARAYINQSGELQQFYIRHLWEPTEFGKQERVDARELPPGAELCPCQRVRRTGRFE